MDSWTDKQVKLMENGGNEKLVSFLHQRGVEKSVPIHKKYNTPEAELYRERMKALVEGRELPTELPKRVPAPVPSDGEGGGQVGSALEPLQGETEAQYVARQRQLNEEARQRMKAKFGPAGLSGGGGGGRMQGFGSDPNYDPSKGGFGGGKGQDIGGEIMGAVGKLGLTVQAHLQEGQLGQKLQMGWSNVSSRVQDPELAAKVKEKASTGWSALATGAVALWSKTADLTVDLVKDITKEEEEPMRLYNRSGGEGAGRGGLVMEGLGSRSGRSSSNSSSRSGGGGSGMGGQQQHQQSSMLGMGTSSPFVSRGGGGGLGGSGNVYGKSSRVSGTPMRSVSSRPLTGLATKADGWDDDEEDLFGGGNSSSNSGGWEATADHRAPPVAASTNSVCKATPSRPLPPPGVAATTVTSTTISSSSGGGTGAADYALDLDVDAFMTNVRVSKPTSSSSQQAPKEAAPKDEDFFSTFGV